VLAAPALVAVTALPLCSAMGWWWGVAAAIATIGASLGVNRDLLGFFAAKRGILFGLGAWVFHQVHLLVAAAAFASVSLRRPAAARRMLRSRV
jgi:hypothetical protein